VHTVAETPYFFLFSHDAQYLHSCPILLFIFQCLERRYNTNKKVSQKDEMTRVVFARAPTFLLFHLYEQQSSDNSVALDIKMCSQA
jgi:hypothetical protein